MWHLRWSRLVERNVREAGNLHAREIICVQAAAFKARGVDGRLGHFFDYTVDVAAVAARKGDQSRDKEN